MGHRRNGPVDIVAVGEGEITFSEVLRQLASGSGDLASVKGVVYRDHGELRVNDSRPVIENLGDIPSPFLSEQRLSRLGAHQ